MLCDLLIGRGTPYLGQVSFSHPRLEREGKRTFLVLGFEESYAQDLNVPVAKKEHIHLTEIPK